MLIYIHKEHELDDVEQRYPAEHYVLVDDKLRILTAMKRSGAIAVDDRLPAAGTLRTRPESLADYPPADITINRIGELVDYDLPGLLEAGRKR